MATKSSHMLVVEIDGKVLYPDKITGGLRLPMMNGETNRAAPEPYGIMFHFNNEGPIKQLMQWVDKTALKKVSITMNDPTNVEKKLLEITAEEAHFLGWDISTDGERTVMYMDIGRPKKGKINGKVNWELKEAPNKWK